MVDKLENKVKIILIPIIIFALFWNINILSQQNSWYQTNGPYGASVGSIVSDSLGDLFAGTDEGIFKSINNGLSWSQIAFKDTSVTGLIINKNGYFFAYMGLVSGFGPYSPLRGIYRSTDGGMSWGKLTSGYPSGWTVTLITLSKDGYLYAGVIANGLYRSTDNGNTWTKAGFSSFSDIIQSLTFGNNGNGYLGTDFDGIYRSTDSCNSWLKVSTLNCFSLVINSEGHVLAGTEKGLYISTDEGISWNFAGLENNWVHDIIIDSSGNIYAGTSNGLWKSSDNGNSWFHVNLWATYINSLFLKQWGEMYAGTLADGIFHTTDNGNNWVQTNTGIINTTMNSVASGSNKSLLAPGDNGLFRSTNSGESWIQIAFIDTGIGFVMEDSFGRIFACSGYSIYAESQPGLFCSYDEGFSWQKLIKNHTMCVAVKSSDVIFAGVDSGGIYRSTDGGSTWVNNGILSGSVSSVLIAADKSVIACNHNSIYRSTNDGDSWVEVLPHVGLYSGIMKMDPQGRIFAIGFGIYRSTDNGANWSWLPIGMDIRAIAINSLGYIFAGTFDQGVGRSTDHGETWADFSVGLLQQYIKGMGVDSNDNIYIGTWGHGIYRTLLSTPVFEKANNFPPKYSLLQNYPNPFNPSTIISYTLPKSGNVSLKVYDILGNEVAALVNAYKTKGVYNITFDASKLTSGVYIYQLRSNDFVSCMKMILTK